MIRYMLDTNICIYTIKGRPAALAQRFDELADELCISVITLGELFFGAENSGQRFGARTC
jgi:tRNA(fMet)-specific endonuclease VapC